MNQLNIKSVNGGMAYIDSPTQALWGVVSKPYVDTTITDAATLLAQGRAALELCCNPHVSYGVTCKDISILTGEPLDAFYTGRMARIIYRDYGLTIRGAGEGDPLSQAHHGAVEREADHRQPQRGRGFCHRSASKRPRASSSSTGRAARRSTPAESSRTPTRKRPPRAISTSRTTWYISTPSC